jgi:hypothetical protein
MEHPDIRAVIINVRKENINSPYKNDAAKEIGLF